jgi:hypothetical protein
MNNTILKTIAINTFLRKPDFSIVIKENIIPEMKISGEKINVSKMSLSVSINKLTFLLTKEIIIRHAKTSVHT